MSRPKNITDDEWLAWLGTIGKWPEAVRDLGEQYPGCTCYRLKKAHVWAQNYRWRIPAEDEDGVRRNPEMWIDCIQGKDSVFPGTLIQQVPVAELKMCDCGDWLPPTREQGQFAEQRYKQAMMKARRVLN